VKQLKDRYQNDHAHSTHTVEHRTFSCT